MPNDPNIPFTVVLLRLFVYGLMACALIGYGLLHL